MRGSPLCAPTCKIATTAWPVKAEAVCQTQLGTVINNAADVRVSTIEHLMAALAALSIDNCVVELDGPEVPIMDGSSEPFVQILDRAGRRRNRKPPASISRSLSRSLVEEGDKRASLLNRRTALR